jgi:hypothetical protein
MFVEDKKVSKDQSRKMLTSHHPNYTWPLPCRDPPVLSELSTKMIPQVDFQECIQLNNKTSRSAAPKGHHAYCKICGDSSGGEPCSEC